MDGPRERERVTERVERQPEDDSPGAPATEPVAYSGSLGAGPDGAPLGSDARITLPPAAYEVGEALGRGGMGEVLAAFDKRIGRGVAIKRMRAPHPTEEATARFLREARIQARLDHPAIVPVHELGTDAEGRPYFTMKRLSGRTLAQKLVDGAPPGPLLRAFVDACRAIELAHARGVVHRDLKPSNIMLGDYGEVYVLDWGVARVLGEPSPSLPPVPELTAPSDDGEGDRDASDASTRTGTVLGTPGYIAPEQLSGDAAAPPADVYALGAILFELLTGEALHPKGHQKAIASTLSAPQELPSARRPDRAIPPELDTVCFAALAEDPAQRPTAHQLAAQVQAYLDGDRDVERRRALAARQLTSARSALESGDADGRTTALRRAGRALALDPESEAAAELISSLLLEPPTPASSPQLAASLEQHEAELARDRSRKAIYAYLSVFLLLPAVFLLEVKNWAMVIACYAALGAGIAVSAWSVRTGRPSVPLTLAVTLVLAVLFTRIASPLILAPVLICCVLAAITSIPAIALRPWLVMSWALVAVMLPFALEYAGVLERTWQFTGTAIAISGDLFVAAGRPEAIALVVANLAFTMVVGWLALAISRRRLSAQRQLYVQAWHLGQLVPGPATGIPSTGLRRPRTMPL